MTVLASAQGFFHSSTWYVLRNLAIFFVIVFWVATVYWVYKDARRRIEDRLAVGRCSARARPRPVHRPADLHAVPAAGVPGGRPRARPRDPRDGEAPRRPRPALPGLPGRGGRGLPRLPGLHDRAPPGVRRLRQAARGAVAGLPVLRDQDPGSRRRARPPRGRVRTPPAARAAPPPRFLATIGPRMAVERTLILAKPDAVARQLAGEILARFERRGLKLRAARLVRASRELGETHYAEHSAKPFFGELVDFITSGPTLAFVLEGEGAIATCRKTIGATNPGRRRPGLAARRVRARDAGQPRPRLRLARVGRARDRDLVPRWAGLTTRREEPRALDPVEPRVHRRERRRQLGARRDLVGHLGDRRVRAERPRRRRGPRRRRARLRHRLLLGLAREARRAADRRRHHARRSSTTARRLMARDRHRVPARSRPTRRRPGCPTRAPTWSSPSTAPRSGSTRTAGSPRPRACCAPAAGSCSCATRRS